MQQDLDSHWDANEDSKHETNGPGRLRNSCLVDDRVQEPGDAEQSEVPGSSKRSRVDEHVEESEKQECRNILQVIQVISETANDTYAVWVL